MKQHNEVRHVLDAVQHPIESFCPSNHDDLRPPVLRLPSISGLLPQSSSSYLQIQALCCEPQPKYEYEGYSNLEFPLQVLH